MCGEKFMRPCLSIIMLGSPPHVRGKAHQMGLKSVKAGITPACAGKRRSDRRDLHRDGDHPRMCGEK